MRPSRLPRYVMMSHPPETIHDVSLQLVIATTVSLLVYALPTPSTQQSEKAAGKQKENALPELDLLKTVDRPALPGQDAGSSFRAVRHNPADPKIAYTIINTVPPRTRTKKSPRRAFVCRWDADQWQVVRLRQVSDRGLTCLDVRYALKISLDQVSCPDARVMASVDGRFVAFGSSDYTIGILDAKTLAVCASPRDWCIAGEVQA